jgi:glutathione S-transferase
VALTLYYHPFSSYCWKVLIPLYEAGTPFTPRTLEDPQAAAELKQRWPIGRFPVLVEDSSALTLPEASIIIEYLDTHHPGPQPLLPVDAALRLEVRLLDRCFDNYVHGSLQKIVADRLRAAERHDAQGVEEAHAMLDTCYGWLEHRMAGRTWAVGEDFTLADCAAAPALFYADWVHPIAATLPNLAAYRARLLARPSVRQVVDAARPYRGYFPGGAPERD